MRQLHLYREDIAAPEVVDVVSIVVRDEYDPTYRVVRPCEHAERHRHHVPAGTTDRQLRIAHEASQALMRDHDRRKAGRML